MSDAETNSAEVYLFGKTKLSGDQKQFYIRNDPIIQMAAGDQHTLVVTESGRVFAFGENNLGQLGLGHTENVRKVSCIKRLKFGETGEKVILVACGRDSSFAATNHGSLYGFGSNSRSQLALESSDTIQVYSEPTKIKTIPSKVKWKQIDMGAEHSCALTTNGEVFVWGSNDDGQCGISKKIDTIDKPRQLKLSYRVASIVCGYYHTALISEDGRLFMCGNNDDRQLGRSIPDSASGPLEVSIPGRVKTAACGNQHTVVLTEEGKVYVCGRGDRGQLGLGPTVQTAETFEEIDGLRRHIVDIAAGEGHTVLLDARGQLHVFGDGKHGKLGFDTHTNEFEPRLLHGFNQFIILKMVCGGCQTIFLAEKKVSDQQQLSDSDEDEGTKIPEADYRQRSIPRTKRIETLTNRLNDSKNTKLQQIEPLGTTPRDRFRDNTFLRTEPNSDSEDDNLGVSPTPSTRSEFFNTTVKEVNGRLRSIHPPLASRTARMSPEDDFRPLKTGALDRSVPLRLGRDEPRDTEQRHSSTERSPSPDATLNQRRMKLSSHREQENSDDEYISKKERQETSKVKHHQRSPPAILKRSNHRRSPTPSENDDDDNDERHRTPPRISTRRQPGKANNHSSSSPEKNNHHSQQYNRRSQSPPIAHSSQSISPSNKGNQTLPARQPENRQNDFSNTTTRTLPTPTQATNTSQQSSTTGAINKAQPSFFSRLFTSNTSNNASTTTNNNSRTCSIM